MNSSFITRKFQNTITRTEIILFQFNILGFELGKLSGIMQLTSVCKQKKETHMQQITFFHNIIKHWIHHA